MLGLPIIGPALAWIVGSASKLWLYLGIAAAIAGAFAFVIFRAKSEAVAGERAKRAIEAGKVRHEQLKDVLNAPRGERTVDSLRDGTF